MKTRPTYERIDVPYKFSELAERRTEFLLYVMMQGNVSMRQILASAYLMGLSDAAEASHQPEHHKHDTD